MDINEGLDSQLPSSALVDISPQILALATLLMPTDPILASRDIQCTLEDVLARIYAPQPPEQSQTASSPLGAPPPPPPDLSDNPLASCVDEDVKISRKTTLSLLYTYAEETFLEYPETSLEGVGHLFLMDAAAPEDWRNPLLDFAYSLGAPKGYSQIGHDSYVSVLTDRGGEMVPCRVQNVTCQGCKICPQVDQRTVKEPHFCASRALLQERLRNDRDIRLSGASPSRDIFQKTAALVAALRKIGCSAPLCEETLFDSDEEEVQDALIFHRRRHQRGYVPKTDSCEGRLYLSHDFKGRPLIKCEHYSTHNNKDHYINTAISDGSYDIEYLEALFSGDEEDVSYIEEAGVGLGYGPLVECTTVCNYSSQKTLCPFEHRDSEGDLAQLEMVHLTCECKVNAYVPLIEYRAECPKVLVVVKGVHRHPIPLPMKTPRAVKTEILDLLPRFQEDLPDLTPRRFLRNPIVKSYLALKFPEVLNPTLSDLHTSLANRSHLKAYIDQIRKAIFPHGTDWKGVFNLEIKHRLERPLKDRYIRFVVDVDASKFAIHPEDELSLAPSGPCRLQFIVCMGWEGSDRLRRCQYVQSDIGFKRVVGFYEFELAGWERDAHTAVVFCRIFLNRQTAVAHQRIFQAIESVVIEDTGKELQWRHIHGVSTSDYNGKILQWAADQHAGQAKGAPIAAQFSKLKCLPGLGLHLQAISQKFPEKMDLHEPHRKLASLGPYEQLIRLFRLCVAHGYRNIQKCKVPDAVKALMRSLICIEHDDWDGTVEKIKLLGGKAGCDWVRDKERSHFAFAGMCWAKSFIPKLVWQAGERTSNLIESVHADINREGVHCTLLGGVLKGEFYDTLQMKTLRVFEESGIRPSYSTGHPTENAVKNLKRKFSAYRKGLEAEDSKIWDANVKIQEMYERFSQARSGVNTAAAALLNCHPAGHPRRYTSLIKALEVAETRFQKEKNAYRKEVEVGKLLSASGSGKVLLIYSAGDL
ncbi:hypothetical protein C8R47DRAFT_393343 [Mycena vitilis]|nr:hypothetical protein C8R47DRAFT_654037 [Mycena vitilis]KAJ6493923.1 hypothetical protein C8R47DRAFT_393343 [Mycena vitilis]